jgi:autotransporter passenger strand-loop-strand repeat protein
MSGSSTPPIITSFTAGDIVISVVGDGEGGGDFTDNQAAPIVLEEIDPTTGLVVGQLDLPQESSTVNGVVENAISGEYGSSSEGSLELAGNGESLVIAGYGVNATTFNSGGAAVFGSAALAQSTSIEGGEVTPVSRVIADISFNGTVDTSTALFNVFNTNNPRSVATENGSTFFISGQGVKGDDTQGVFVADDGANSATSIDDATDTRTVEIVNGQLFVSIDSTQPDATGTSNISTFGDTLPASETTATALPGISQSTTLSAAQENSVNSAAVGTAVALSPENFFFANDTTLYVADGGNPKEGTAGDGGLQKWSFNGTTWVLDYTLSAGLNLVPNPSVDPSSTSGTTGLIGLTGTVNADGTVTFFATNATIGDLDQTFLYTIKDTLSATTAPDESFTVVTSAAADTNIRGVAFAPTAPTTPPVSTTVTSGQTQSGITVSSGGLLTVDAGGTVTSTTILSGGSAVVLGVDSGTFIAEGGNEILSGSATGDTIFGTQLVSAGAAVVSNETVFNGGSLDLFLKGAIANNTILSGGSLNINGSATASNTTITNGGAIVLESPKATLGGTVTFSGAGSISVTDLSSAGDGDQAVISGFAAGDAIDVTVIGGGAMLTSSVVSGNTVETITSSGVSQSFIFAGSSFAPGFFVVGSDGGSGTLLTVSAATPVSTTITSGQTQSGLIVPNEATVNVLGGGSIVSATILSGGLVVDAGVDSGTTISAGGNETVLGSATGDQIFGTQLVSAGTAVVSNETVFSGGALDLFLKGGIVNNALIESGGFLNINGNATAVDTVINGGTIDLQSPKANLTGAVTFTGGPGVIEVTDTTSAGFGDLAVISGFAVGDIIDETVIGGGATLSSSVVSGNTVETITSGGTSESFIFAGSSFAPDFFTLIADGTGGEALVASGTTISSGSSSSSSSGSSSGSSSSLTIASGVTQSGLVVSGGETLTVQEGGTALSATVFSGGLVLDSGIDSGTTIAAGANETVLGTATGDQIFGTQLVSAATAVVNNETVFNGGSLDLFLKGAVANNTTVSSGGSLNISGNATATDTVLNGGAIVLESPKAVLSGTVTFTGSGGEIQVTDTTSAGFGDFAVISGFGAGDVIDVTSAVMGGGAVLSSSVVSGNTVETITSGSVTESFIFGGTIASNFFSLQSDGNGGEEIVANAPCYCLGTNIRTVTGETPVEALKIGDMLLTESGAARPIKWIGTRSYDGKFIAGQHLMLPVCIKANAIADGVPARDLHVSPGHAIFCFGMLVPAWRLINGVSITQAEQVERVTYFHIELESHDVILAENCPAESFLDDGCRGQFHNAATFEAMYPQDEPAPGIERVESGHLLAAVQYRLATRAGVIMPHTQTGGLIGYVDRAEGGLVSGWAQNKDAPEAPVFLDIYSDGQHVVQVLANAYRADLRAVGIGSGCHAFEVRLPAGCTGQIEVRRAADQAVLSFTGDAKARAA